MQHRTTGMVHAALFVEHIFLFLIISIQHVFILNDSNNYKEIKNR